MASFGSGLRQKREAQGVLLEDISAATRVSVRYLESLEADDFKALPGGVFNRGIVRGYARFLQIDEQETVSHFMDACRSAGITDGTEQDWGEFAQNVSRQRSSSTNRRRWIGVGIMLAIVFAIGALIYATLLHRGVVSKPHFHKNPAPSQSEQ